VHGDGVRPGFDYATRGRWQFGPDLAWQTLAACAKASRPDEFFPDKGRPSNTSKALCAVCAVRVPCLNWALVHKERGTWGGLTESQRARLARSTSALDGRRPLL
jgi:WhiB family redox-sensing transcriptional regulator